MLVLSILAATISLDFPSNVFANDHLLAVITPSTARIEVFDAGRVTNAKILGRGWEWFLPRGTRLLR